MQTIDPRRPSTSLWLLDGRAVNDGALASFLPLLSPDETERHRRFLRAERRRQFLLGRMLLRSAVNNLTGIPAAAIGTIDRSGFGPQLLLPEGIPPPHFSLSHSREWIACAVSADHALGLDIEVLDVQRDILALSEASFHIDEHSWLLRLNGTERVDAFYRIWTLKEALFKLRSNCGEQQHVPAVVARDGQLVSQDAAWFSSRLEHPQLSITLCSAQPLPDIDLIQVRELV